MAGIVAALAWQNLSGPAVVALFNFNGSTANTLGRALSGGSKIIPIIAPQTVFDAERLAAPGDPALTARRIAVRPVGAHR